MAEDKETKLNKESAVAGPADIKKTEGGGWIDPKSDKELDKMRKGKPCPGSKIKSRGKGRGAGVGKGRGPVGIPVGKKAELDPSSGNPLEVGKGVSSEKADGTPNTGQSDYERMLKDLGYA